MAKIVRDDRAAQDALTVEPSITGKRGKVIARIYSRTGDAMAYVYAIEKEHRFPNGKVEEGWLMEPAHLVGEDDPIWSVKPQNSPRVEWVK